MKLTRHNAGKNRSNGGFTLLEALIAGGVLAVFAIGAGATFTSMNTIASRTRTAVVAECILQSYVDEATAAVYTTTSPPAVLATTVSGSDVDGDGEGDGVVYASNVPLLIARDSKTGGIPQNIVTATVYRQSTMVNNPLQILRVTFLIRYTERGKTYNYKLAILKAGEN